MCKISQRKSQVIRKITVLRWSKEKQKILPLNHQPPLYHTMFPAKNRQRSTMTLTHSTRKKRKQLWLSFRNFQKNKLTALNKEVNSSKQMSLSITILLFTKEELRKWPLLDQNYSRLRLLLKTFLESTIEPKV